MHFSEINPNICHKPLLAMYKGPYRPNAIRQRDTNFQFLKINKSVNG